MHLVVVPIMLVDIFLDIVAVMVQKIRIEQVVDQGSLDIDKDLDIGFLLDFLWGRIDNRLFVMYWISHVQNIVNTPIRVNVERPALRLALLYQQR
jgi:hypothetical protein